MASPILDVRDLSVEFATRAGTARAVDGVSLRLAAGETLCIVGESGCGKSITALSIMGLVPFPGRVTGGKIRLDGTEIEQLPIARRDTALVSSVQMVFQNPFDTLNPSMTVGRQILRTLELFGVGRTDAMRRSRMRLSTPWTSGWSTHITARP